MEGDGIMFRTSGVFRIPGKKSAKPKVVISLLLSAYFFTLTACYYFDPFNPYGQEFGYWARSFGGLENEQVRSMLITDDGSSLLAGSTATYGARDGSAWLVNLDQQGRIIWQKAYNLEQGTTCLKEVYSDFIQTGDKQYTALVNLIESDELGRETDSDFCLFKLDHTGGIVWTKLLASEGREQAFAMREVPPAGSGSQAGLVIAGYLDFNQHFLIPNAPENLDKDYAAFILKLNHLGQFQWQTILQGGTGFDEARAVSLTREGGFYLGGNRTSTRGDSDYWLLKLDNGGNLLNDWSKTFGGPGDDFLRTMEPTADDGLLLTGISSSGSAAEPLANGKVPFSHWLLKLNREGGIEWQKRYAETEINHENWKNYTNAIREIGRDQYILALTVPAADARTTDLGILKLDKTGNIIWQKRYGGMNSDEAVAIQPLLNGGYLTAGYTRSFGDGGFDFWAIRLLPDGSCPLLEQPAQFNTSDSHIFAGAIKNEIQKAGSEVFLGITTSTIWTVTETDCTVQQQAP
jgi:hypothetical protein